MTAKDVLQKSCGAQPRTESPALPQHFVQSRDIGVRERFSERGQMRVEPAFRRLPQIGGETIYPGKHVLLEKCALPGEQTLGFLSVATLQRRNCFLAQNPHEDELHGQWNLLNQLEQAGALSQRKLAEQTKKEQATITRYLDTLERKGLIVRTRDANDRRAHVITITNEARTLLDQVGPLAEEASRRLTEGITSKELESFLAVIDKLSRNANSYIEGKEGTQSPVDR